MENLRVYGQQLVISQMHQVHRWDAQDDRVWIFEGPYGDLVTALEFGESGRCLRQRCHGVRGTDETIDSSGRAIAAGRS